jgi:hypothetical protein
MATEVTLSGPLFDARAAQVMHAMMDDCSQAIAERAATDVRTVIRHDAIRRTGNYERHVQIDRAGTDRQVNDSGIVYGPWLEGVSSRNHSTRFKGYAQFRRATQQLDGRTAEIAEPAVRRRIGQLQ